MDAKPVIHPFFSQRKEDIQSHRHTLRQELQSQGLERWLCGLRVVAALAQDIQAEKTNTHTKIQAGKIYTYKKYIH